MGIIKKNCGLTFALISSLALTCASCSSDEDEFNSESQKLAASMQQPHLSGVIKNALTDQSGQVKDFDCYGMLEPSFTPEDMKNAGFDYGDLLNIKVGKNIELKNVPYVTGFNEVGVFETCLCDYNAKGTTFGLGQLHGNFMERIGGVKGDSITVSLAQKQGYKDTWEIMKSVYNNVRSNYAEETDEEFANFRPVTTTGMGKGVLYRSSNPLNNTDNDVRYWYVDSLARHYGICTEIDLADTQKKIFDYLGSAGYKSTYCPTLFHNGKVIALGLTADTYGREFMTTLADGLRFMINNEPPYLLHCNEGKDRCGFVSMLLEALAGATYEDVANDYMKTLQNFYKIEPGSESYQMRQRLSIDRLVWLLGYVKTVTDFQNINWDGKNPTKVDLQKAAEKYVKECGLTADECSKLQAKLQGKCK